MHTLDDLAEELVVIKSKVDAIHAEYFPPERFSDLGNGTVRDNKTMLIWLKDANCFGEMDWCAAMDVVSHLAHGQCDLEDGSVEDDWRLPTTGEWEDFVDTNYTNPALSNAAGTGQWTEGDAFTGVQSNYYWSSTDLFVSCRFADSAWYVHMGNGALGLGDKDYNFYVWPVRSGN
jgi:hypothetical protein